MSDIREMNQKFMVSVMGLVLFASIPTLIQIQVQAQEEEQSPPGAVAHIKKNARYS
jgi:hypothetical protein